MIQNQTNSQKNNKPHQPLPLQTHKNPTANPPKKKKKKPIESYLLHQAFDLHEPVLSQAATHNPNLHPKTNPTSTTNP